MAYNKGCQRTIIKTVVVGGVISSAFCRTATWINKYLEKLFYYRPSTSVKTLHMFQVHGHIWWRISCALFKPELRNFILESK